MNLRGHHLLCVFGWQGFGYSQSFNMAMDETVCKLADPKTIIKTTTSPDNLCLNCPNLRSDGCYKGKSKKEQIIMEHDKRILSFLGLTSEAVISAGGLKKFVSKRKPYRVLSKLCIDCSWLKEGYCYEGLRAIKD